jgi:hypothetical protein
MYSKKRLYRHKRLQEWANEELGSALLSATDAKSLPTETKEEKKNENQVVVAKKESKLDILRYRLSKDVWWNICKFLKWQDRIRLKHACTLGVVRPNLVHPNLTEIQKIACPDKYSERQLATACMLEWLNPQKPFSMDNRLDTSKVLLPPPTGKWYTRDINYAIVVDDCDYKTVTHEQLEAYRITYGRNALLSLVTTSSVMKLAVTSFYTHKWDTIKRRVDVHLLDCLANKHKN